MTGFTRIPETGSFVLANVSVPASLVDDLPPEALADTEELVRLAKREASPSIGVAPRRAERSIMTWPDLVDVHTHLDKAFTWPRCPNPDGCADMDKRTSFSFVRAHSLNCSAGPGTTGWCFVPTRRCSTTSSGTTDGRCWRNRWHALAASR